MPHILVIDQGTHASRAILFSANGQIIQQNQQAVSLNRIDDHQIEQDASQLLSSVATAIEQLDPAELEQAGCCCIATQRSTIVAWHADTGQAISPALSWQDRRSYADLQLFKAKEGLIKHCTGLPLSPHYGAGKIRWLLRHNQQVTQALADDNLRIGPLASYLLRNLLNNQPDRLDHSNAHRTLLFDLATLDWSSELLDLFQIPRQILPQLSPMMSAYGRLKAHDIPVTAVCGDQSASLYAQGKIQPGSAMVNLGTGGFILAPSQSKICHTDLLCGISYSDQQQHEYVLEGTVNGAGSALSYLQGIEPVEGLFEQLPDWLSEIETPAIFINTVGGLGSPWWKEVPAPYFLCDQDSNQQQRYIAVIESIVFLLTQNIAQLKNTLDISQLTITGGLSQLDGLCQKLANLSQLPVLRSSAVEGTAKGAAWLAAACPDDWFTQSDYHRFQPQHDPTLKKRYILFDQEIRSL